MHLLFALGGRFHIIGHGLRWRKCKRKKKFKKRAHSLSLAPLGHTHWLWDSVLIILSQEEAIHHRYFVPAFELTSNHLQPSDTQLLCWKHKSMKAHFNIWEPVVAWLAAELKEALLVCVYLAITLLLVAVNITVCQAKYLVKHLSADVLHLLLLQRHRSC